MNGSDHIPNVDWYLDRGMGQSDQGRLAPRAFVICRSCGHDDEAVNQSACRKCGSKFIQRCGGRA